MSDEPSPETEQIPSDETKTKEEVVSKQASASISTASENSADEKNLGCGACGKDDFDETNLLNRSDAWKPDAANTEYVYYSATLRETAMALTNYVDRQGVIPWLRKLFQPEYHISRMRTKRNKYLLYLTLTLMNNELFGIFRSTPPQGALPDFETLPSIVDYTQLVAEWEKDTMWQDILIGMPQSHVQMECSYHSDKSQCLEDKANGDLLDDEFSYLLYLARPFAVLLKNPDDRTKIASWFQTLCTIQKTSCSAMKYIRNEYITALLGYLHELRVAGPFSEYPGWNPLPPLTEAAKIIADHYPIIDPCFHEQDEFFSKQPVPDEGAFCFLAVTGDLLDSSLNELD